MSFTVVNNYEKMVNLKNFLRVVIVDNGGFNDTLRSLESVNSISNEIPISILTNDGSHDEYDELNIIKIKSNENILEKLNRLLIDNGEDFICILNSNNLLLDSFLKIFDDTSYYDVNSVGAIVFDDQSNDGEPNYKLGFSKDLYLETDYIHNSVFINRGLLNEIGGFNIKFKNNFIRDAIFRLYDRGHEIIKKDILAFEIDLKRSNSIFSENKLFLETTLNRQGIEYGVVEKNNNAIPIYSPQNNRASIIIPFKNQIDVTRNCIESIMNKTEYGNYEIILINNNSSEELARDFLEEMSNFSKVRVYDYKNPFNWSKINNFAVSKSTGEVLIFLNNDTEVISSNWLTLLIGDAIQEKTGCVGAKLFYPDNTIQHAGVVIGLGSLASHIFSKNHETEIPDLYNSYRRNVSAVTGACLAIEKDLFVEVNGFNERFEVSFSDAELCLRLLKKGYENIFNPDVKLYHHEMKTRSRKEFREIDRVLGYNAFSFYFEHGDPFFNENYSLNNPKRLTLKEDNEIPGFEKYWNNWSKNRNNRINKINQIRNNEKNTFGSSYLDVSKEDLLKNAILMDEFFNNRVSKLNDVLWFIPSFEDIAEDILYDLFVLPNFLSINEGTYNIFVLENDENKNKIEEYIKINFPSLNYKLLINSFERLPKSDISFCFDWKTSFNLLKYDKCLAKFYLINDCYGNQNRLKEQSYHFDFIGISNSENFAADYKKDNNSIMCYNPLINKDIYYLDVNVDRIDKSLLIHADNLQKDDLILINSIVAVVKEYFDGQVKIFVVGEDNADLDLGDAAVNLGKIESSQDLAEWYQKCSAVLTLDSSYNPVNKIVNAMACGCVNITNINDNLPELLRNNENIIISDQIATAMSEEIIIILENDDLRKKLIDEGLKTIDMLNCEEEMKNILIFIKEPVISRLVENSDDNSNLIKKSEISQVPHKYNNTFKSIKDKSKSKLLKLISKDK